MRRAATLGAALLLGSATLSITASPASAQPHVDCWGPIQPACAVVNKVLATAPYYVQRVQCVISGECP